MTPKSTLLSLGVLTFAGFAARGFCFGFDVTKTYGEIGVDLARVPSFIASPTGPDNR
jgi:hypothetical protein